MNDEPAVAPPARPDPAHWDDNTITAAWIGHATVLINFFGVKILTDPVFSDRIGLNFAGLFTIGPRRLVLPALTMEELPPIDLILLSHAHMDHLDLPSLERLDPTIPVVMAQNTTDVLYRTDFRMIYELDWGEWAETRGVRIEALEVTHFGWRYPWERDRSGGYADGRSYNAYLLSRNGRHILFGGDTSYNEHFLSLRERGITVDLAIMPIGAYDPWIRVHANPEQALAMSDHCNARHILPIHWRTFRQSDEPLLEPIERLRRAAGSRQDRIVIDDIGQTWAMALPVAAEEPEPVMVETPRPGFEETAGDAR
jgi:L-ascorbate metabolism protein UlaG (beta-lactamase superfamily)